MRLNPHRDYEMTNLQMNWWDEWVWSVQWPSERRQVRVMRTRSSLPKTSSPKCWNRFDNPGHWTACVYCVRLWHLYIGFLVGIPTIVRTLNCKWNEFSRIHTLRRHSFQSRKRELALYSQWRDYLLIGSLILLDNILRNKTRCLVWRNLILEYQPLICHCLWSASRQVCRTRPRQYGT